jgi:hypothetical protein
MLIHAATAHSVALTIDRLTKNVAQYGELSTAM